MRPDVAWDLKQTVETIADLSVELGIPFISGKDSSSGTMESAGRRIDVPPTLVVATLGRVLDVKKVVTKEFKRPGNKLVLVGHLDPEALGGSVYADSYGQRGERLFDAYDGAAIRALWDALLRLHQEGSYVSASAIAEGGLLLRVFEAAFGSGLGATVNLDVQIPGRKDGLLFGESIGTVLLEVAPGCDLEKSFRGVPHRVIGEVTQEPRISLAQSGTIIWQESVATLAAGWARTFREVVK